MSDSNEDFLAQLAKLQEESEIERSFILVDIEGHYSAIIKETLIAYREACMGTPPELGHRIDDRATEVIVDAMILIHKSHLRETKSD